MSVIQYTPAIDIWSIGCIFAEVLIGKPLFPGKSVVHQLDLITDLLGTPSSDTVSGVRNEKARRYLTEMRRKYAVPFVQKFPIADPLALRLLERMLSFDPKDRPTAAEALTDPYFKGLAKVEREPSCQPISKLEFEFERRRVTKEDVRELIFREILEYHPQLLKDYMNGTEGTNFLYPSAIGQFRKQFAHLEENGGKSGPVIPLERKHVSLPRSTVHSSTIPAKAQADLSSCVNQQSSEEACNKYGGSDAISGNLLKASRPPPRVPSAKPGRVVGPVLPYENGRSIKETYNARIYMRNAIVPAQAVSPNYLFRANTNREKSGTEAEREFSQAKVPHKQCNMAAKPAPGIAIDINTNPNPYYHPTAKVEQLDDRIMIDAKLLQAQSQIGAINAAAVAVAAHINVGTVQYGMT